MSTSSLFVLGITLIAGGLLISGRLRPDLIALLIMVVLGLSGTVAPRDVFSGFSSSAVITILGISIISTGLQQTGVTLRLGHLMRRLGHRSETGLVLTVTLVSAALSLFMNNIAAVGVLLPAVMSVARQSNTPPSKLLMPLAYGTILGGMATLLTTSNIIASGALREAGLQPFGLLDFLPVGIPIVAIGSLYITFVGRHWLPRESPGLASRTITQLSAELANLYHLHDHLETLEILPHSPLAHRSIAESDFANRLGLIIVGVLSNGALKPAPPKSYILSPGDHLLVKGHCDPATLEMLGLNPASSPTPASMLISESVRLAEVVISPHSTLIGRTLKSTHFREKYNLNVISIWREGHPLHADLGNIPLQVGDALLVQGSAARIRMLREDSDLILLEEDPDAVLIPHKYPLAFWITLLTLGIAALGILPVAEVVLAGAVLLLLTRCLSMDDAYRNIEWKAIFVIAGMWPLSIAIRTSGLSDFVALKMIDLVGQGSSTLIVLTLILLALGFTQLLGGQVAALVLAPLALSSATQTGLDARGLMMAVALGCSLAFPTPFGHPVNIMVMSSGGYTLKDFVKVGTPLTILTIITILVGLKLFWGV
ncbi:MAG: SLC13 family permease [Thermanaerothrix sp.]|uniref:SLC13 family permease n=1 Tax=Thermanaerothrix sp. TaxID=2972675 RepID=UPI003C7D7C83